MAWLQFPTELYGYWNGQQPGVVVLHQPGKLTSSDLEMAGVLLQYLVAKRLQHHLKQCQTSTRSYSSTPDTSWLPQLLISSF